jgi:hypothetical protein
MITNEQKKKILEIVGSDILVTSLNGNGNGQEMILIGDYQNAKNYFLEVALDWNSEVIEFVKNTTPEERKELARLARISKLEKELSELKSK